MIYVILVFINFDIYKAVVESRCAEGWIYKLLFNII